jgi:hypothetical protein
MYAGYGSISRPGYGHSGYGGLQGPSKSYSGSRGSAGSGSMNLGGFGIPKWKRTQGFQSFQPPAQIQAPQIGGAQSQLNMRSRSSTFPSKPRTHRVSSRARPMATRTWV